MELRLSEVSTADQISIRTRFSNYNFRVTDARSFSGILSGGSLGDQVQHACLIGTVFSGSDGSTYWKELETGGQAVFLVYGEGMKRLTTSVIIALAVSAAPDLNLANTVAV